MSDFSEGHYKHKAKNKFMKAAAQQAQQPLKGVVKAAVQEAHARTTCYKHTAASIAGLVRTRMADTGRIWVGKKHVGWPFWSNLILGAFDSTPRIHEKRFLQA